MARGAMPLVGSVLWQIRTGARNVLAQIPFWPDVVRLCGWITAPLRWLARLTLRVFPFLRRLEGLLEIDSLARRHPVSLALSMLYMLWRGLQKTSLGHIGTDPVVYPFLALVSGFNPFLGIACGVLFGVGDLIQKLTAPDIYPSGVVWGSPDYLPTLAGYAVSYSSLVCMGVLPGLLSRVLRLSVRWTLRVIVYRRASASADGAIPADGAPFQRYYDPASRTYHLDFDDPDVLAVVYGLAMDPRSLLAGNDAWRRHTVTREQEIVLGELRARNLLGPSGREPLRRLLERAEQLQAQMAARLRRSNQPMLEVDMSRENPLNLFWADSFVPLVELLAAVVGGGLGGSLVLSRIAPTLETPAFMWRPNPDTSCWHREIEILAASSASGRNFGALGGALSALVPPGGGSQPPSPPSDDDRVRDLRNLWEANDHDRRQAEANLREMQERLSELSPRDRALLENDPDFIARRRHEEEMIRDAERSKRDIADQVAMFGATPGGGVDPHGDIHRGTASHQADDDLKEARFNDAQDRYGRMWDAAGDRSARAMDEVERAGDEIFDPEAGTVDEGAFDTLRDRLKREHRAEQLSHEGSADAVDNAYQQGLDIAQGVIIQPGQAAAMFVAGPLTLPGALINAGYGTLVAATSGDQGAWDSVKSGLEQAATAAVLDGAFRLAGRAASGLFPATSESLAAWAEKYGGRTIGGTAGEVGDELFGHAAAESAAARTASGAVADEAGSAAAFGRDQQAGPFDAARWRAVEAQERAASAERRAAAARFHEQEAIQAAREADERAAAAAIARDDARSTAVRKGGTAEDWAALKGKKAALEATEREASNARQLAEAEGRRAQALEAAAAESRARAATAREAWLDNDPRRAAERAVQRAENARARVEQAESALDDATAERDAAQRGLDRAPKDADAAANLAEKTRKAAEAEARLRAEQHAQTMADEQYRAASQREMQAMARDARVRDAVDRELKADHPSAGAQAPGQLHIARDRTELERRWMLSEPEKTVTLHRVEFAPGESVAVKPDPTHLVTHPDGTVTYRPGKPPIQTGAARAGVAGGQTAQNPMEVSIGTERLRTPRGSAERVAGFHTSGTNVSTSLPDVGTITHEQVHSLTSPNWRNAYPTETSRQLNEGITEYFTRRHGAAHPGVTIADRAGHYDAQQKFAEYLDRVTGGDLERAWFGGDVDALHRAIGERLGAAPGDAVAAGKAHLEAIAQKIEEGTREYKKDGTLDAYREVRDLLKRIQGP